MLNNQNDQYNPSYPNIHGGYQNPNSEPPKPEKEKSKSKGKSVGFAAIVISLAFSVSVLGGALGGKLSNNENSSPAPVSSNTQQQSDTDTSIKDDSIINTATSNGAVMSMEQIAATASPSVVEITTESVTTGQRMQQLVSTGAGSGVIVSADGYIVTNHHVIEGSSKINVTLKDGTQYSAALMGSDKKTDLAVIKIDATGLTAATIGDSSAIQVGQDAIVIGNPLGQLGGTVTNGIISALDREISFADGTVMRLLQTNAAVNPGNSGGGLFNNKGELVGIVNAKSSGADIEGIGFAIPVNTAKPIINDLVSHGYVQGRVELGVTLLDIADPMSAMMYRVEALGVYVYDIEASSNAAKAGLASGDRITSINGKAVEASTDVTAALEGLAVNEKIIITVDRNGRSTDISFLLQEQKNGNSMAA